MKRGLSEPVESTPTTHTEPGSMCYGNGSQYDSSDSDSFLSYFMQTEGLPSVPDFGQSSDSVASGSSIQVQVNLLVAFGLFAFGMTLFRLDYEMRRGLNDAREARVEEKFTKFSGKPRDAREKNGIQLHFGAKIAPKDTKIQNRAPKTFFKI